MTYAKPGTKGALFTFKKRYDNFIGGDWVAPADGTYFENKSPVDGNVYCEVARSSGADLEKALEVNGQQYHSLAKNGVLRIAN